ncbi:MAG TPA: L-histidine N(alpha)-methyltransferase [Acidobacteriota bacterium]|nr:L-histidine N(alpha)-methyltransferase [Acidobacteriota bacterium]
METPTSADSAQAEQIWQGLSKDGQKTLPPQYLYDEVGSALFESITKLPEYGLTKAEERNLRRCAEPVAEICRSDVMVVELGSGSGRKTRLILEALARRGDPLDYFAIDVSQEALKQCGREMEDIPGVSFTGVQGTYLEGLDEVLAQRPRGRQLLLLFLGSTLGNFEPEQAEDFLQSLSDKLQEGDLFLLGADMVKGEEDLLTAYDDPAGVTAAFNLNLLSRLNREWDADFRHDRFEHHVRYDEDLQRVEMHLRSLQDQDVRLGEFGARLRLRRGETIHTESSHKFRPEDLQRMAGQAGFRIARCWVDDQWPFADCLLSVDHPLDNEELI